MSSAYASWKIRNVLEEHVILDLKQDTVFATGGAFEVKEWAEEVAEEGDQIRNDKVPRIACEVLDLLSIDESTVGGNVIARYGGIVEAILARGSRGTSRQVAKSVASRIERRLLQAARPDMQLQLASSDIEGMLVNSVEVHLTGTQVETEKFAGTQRVAALVSIAIDVEFATPSD